MRPARASASGSRDRNSPVLPGTGASSSLLPFEVRPEGHEAPGRCESAHRRVTWPVYEDTNAIVRLLITDHPLRARRARHAVPRLAGALRPVRLAITRRLTGGVSPGQG